ncbi:MAG: polysulfide reductase NrfD [Chloroflexi bacterium]|nr:polysulfide reductase NrfD [Chloroflexota bacterium]
MQERYALTDRQVHRDLLHFVLVTPAWFWLAAAILGTFVLAAALMYGYVIYEGLWVTGLNRPVYWAFFITTFVFWIGISHAGVMISAILHLSQAEWRRPLTRMAEVLTVFSLLTAGLMVFIHTGRPWRTVYWLLPYDLDRGIFPNVRSPLVWDLAAISTYLTASSLLVFIGLIPDMATAAAHATGWRRRLYGALSLGFRGTPRQWRVHYLGNVLLAALVLAVFVSVHSIVSWDFGMSLVPTWHATVFGPYFVIGAMHSGVAAVAAVMAIFQRATGLGKYITSDHFDAIGRLLIAIATGWLFFFFLEVSFGLITQENQELAVRQLQFLTWPYNLLSVIFILTAYIIPVPIWCVRRFRRMPSVMLWTGLLVQVGMWLERFLIFVPSLQFRQPFTFVWGSYTPSVPEITIVLGSFMFVSLGLLIFSKIFPIVPMFAVKEGQIVKQEIEIGRQKVPAVIKE